VRVSGVFTTGNIRKCKNQTQISQNSEQTVGTASQKVDRLDMERKKNAGQK